MTERFKTKFTSPVYDGETISVTIDGFTVTAKVEHDPDMGPPWDEHDGHGPVSGWTTRSKRPGERVLMQYQRSYQYYDWEGAIEKAREEGWGVHPGKAEGETDRQYRVRAVQRDFDYLKGWCNNEWFWCSVTLSVEYRGVMLDQHAASLCGIDSLSVDYLNDVAEELLDEALEAGRAELGALVQEFVREQPMAALDAMNRHEKAEREVLMEIDAVTVAEWLRAEAGQAL